MSEDVIETDYAGLMAAMEDGPGPLVIDLHAPWCNYCLRTRPHLEALATERKGSIRFVAVDTDEHPDAFDRLSVATLPAIILYQDGKEVARRGSGGYEDLSAWLDEHMR